MRAAGAGVLLALAVAVGLAGCGDADPGEAEKELSGDIRVDGSSTVQPLTATAAELYGEEQPKVKVAVGRSGTGGGFEKFCKGETDISNASRAIKDSEKELCQKNGVTHTELLVANDALTVTVHKDNTWAQCLTVAQLKKIWEPNSKINNWNQVDPSFPNEPLKLFGAGTDSGTFDFFTEVINGKAKASRTDYTASEDDNVLVNGVAGSKGGLGYFGFTYYEENAGKLKALKIDGGSGCVEPSVETAQDGTYKPLSRPLFIYVANKSAQSKEHVRDFVRFYVEKIDTIVEEAKFISLTADQKTKLTSQYQSLPKG